MFGLSLDDIKNGQAHLEAQQSGMISQSQQNVNRRQKKHNPKKNERKKKAKMENKNKKKKKVLQKEKTSSTNENKSDKWSEKPANENRYMNQNLTSKKNCLQITIKAKLLLFLDRFNHGAAGVI